MTFQELFHLFLENYEGTTFLTVSVFTLIHIKMMNDVNLELKKAESVVTCWVKRIWYLGKRWHDKNIINLGTLFIYWLMKYNTISLLTPQKNTKKTKTPQIQAEKAVLFIVLCARLNKPAYLYVYND